MTEFRPLTNSLVLRDKYTKSELKTSELNLESQSIDKMKIFVIVDRLQYQEELSLIELPTKSRRHVIVLGRVKRKPPTHDT